MVSGTNFVVLRTELIKKLNVIEPEKKAFISSMKSTPYFHLKQNFLMAKLNSFSQNKNIGTEMFDIPKCLQSISITLRFFYIILLVKQ